MPNKIIKNYSELNNVNRFDLIKNSIDFIGNHKVSCYYDKRDLTYLIKVLLENGTVRISKKAYGNVKSLWLAKNNYQWQTDALNNMLKNQPQTDRYLQSVIYRKIFTWEHVVPTNVLVDKLLQEWNNKTLNSVFVDNMINKYGYVCIVTKEEDKILNATFKDKMPNTWVYGKDDAFARYTSNNIALM